MRAYLHRLVSSGQSGGYARLFNSPGWWDATRDGVAADEAARRIDATLRAKLQSAGVADPGLDVRIVPELPRQPGHSAKFKLIESRTAPTPVTPAPVN